MSAAPSQLAVGFARVLRGVGIRVPPDTVIRYGEALALVGVDDRDDVYWAGRATLLHRPEDIETYNRAFAVWWERRSAPLVLDEAPPETVTLAVDEDESDDNSDDGDHQRDDNDTIELRFSTLEVLGAKDFADCTSDELDELHRLMNSLHLTGATKRSRRQVRSKGPTSKPDLRRTVRAALKHGGEPIDRHFERPSERPRRLVLLVDVSGSMEPYARALVRFAHAALLARSKVEVFALGTRLTRITRELSSRDLDRALSDAAKRVTDWSGGTRLGDGMKVFNDRWGQRGMARGAVIVVLSDGWDRGDPEMMAEQMGRLHRVAHRVVWVNPLKATPGYAPLARGMAAALPYIDVFVEGHSFDALQQVAAAVSAPSVGGAWQPTRQMQVRQQ
jgi:uncharacterized protein